ncbi:hypothetical protein TanjilG_21795 [Lupinus angustifolius]|uniref:FAS1 domain-containing protein n=1 Tax=Lupinus angustifolius TaxID=3871 RepID=A0A394DBM2_LUPAN|nr:hypothetical protein TanjilG_21795 [Lupinus angustifolius]
MLPYNIIIFSIDSLLIPSRINIMQSETRPNLDLNITKALNDNHNFNVAALLLSIFGVVDEFENDEGDAKIMLFVPLDDAFAVHHHRQACEIVCVQHYIVLMKTRIQRQA